MMFDFEAIDAAQSRQEASDQVRMWIQSWFAVQSAGHEELHGKQVDDTGEYDTYDHGGFKTYGLPSLNLSIPHVDIAELEQSIDRCENHAYRHGLKGQRHVSNRPLPGWHESSARCEKEGFGRSVKYHMRERKAQIRQDRLQSRAARISAFINPKHAVRARGAARRKALSPSWARRRSFSDKEAIIFDFDMENDDDFDMYSDAGSDFGDVGEYNEYEHLERQLESQFVNDSELECYGLCLICHEEKTLLTLNCAHAFCMQCLLRQLATRWTGPQVSFNYLQCGICRQQLGHRELREPMLANLTFKRRVEDMAVKKYYDEGLAAASMSQPFNIEEIRSQAMRKIETFMCSTCCEPFCGGLQDCARQQDLSADDMLCTQCAWTANSGLGSDLRCMKHGPSFAIFKCDFCCSIATYRCGGNTNFCERCHQQAYSNTYYPCPGASCTLGLPHPCISSTKGDGAVRSFVLGCSACMGCMGSGDSNQGMSANSPGQFGYPQRSWEKYAGGDVLLAALGEREVRDRLRLHHPLALQSGGAAECAERLLLLELGIQTYEDVLASIGGQGKMLVRRLEAVGLRQDGNFEQCARRLLLLLASPVTSLSPEHFATEEDEDDDLPPLLLLEKEYQPLID